MTGDVGTDHAVCRVPFARENDRASRVKIEVRFGVRTDERQGSFLQFELGEQSARLLRSQQEKSSTRAEGERIELETQKKAGGTHLFIVVSRPEHVELCLVTPVQAVDACQKVLER